MQGLKDQFGIQSYDELNDLHYILVNRDKMKLPVGGRLSDEEIPGYMPVKFAMNPILIEDKDDLFDLLE